MVRGGQAPARVIPPRAPSAHRRHGGSAGRWPASDGRTSRHRARRNPATGRSARRAGGRATAVPMLPFTPPDVLVHETPSRRPPPVGRRRLRRQDTGQSPGDGGTGPRAACVPRSRLASRPAVEQPLVSTSKAMAAPGGRPLAIEHPGARPGPPRIVMHHNPREHAGPSGPSERGAARDRRAVDRGDQVADRLPATRGCTPAARAGFGRWVEPARRVPARWGRSRGRPAGEVDSRMIIVAAPAAAASEAETEWLVRADRRQPRRGDQNALRRSRPRRLPNW